MRQLIGVRLRDMTGGEILHALVGNGDEIAAEDELIGAGLDALGRGSSGARPEKYTCGS